MPNLWIEAWEWDEYNTSELVRHGLSRQVVLAVAEEKPLFRRNKKRRAATFQMVGPDSGGTMWTVCIVRLSYDSGLWRAVTGWKATQVERTWYQRSS